MDEALAILQALLRATRQDGGWEPAGTTSTVQALHEGDAIEPWETVMHDRGRLRLFAHLETLYLGVLARRTLIRRNVRDVVEAARRQADPLLPRALRPLAGADRRRLGRAHRRRDRGVDRRAGLVVGREGDRHRAPRR